jgi:hypothetical protein
LQSLSLAASSLWAEIPTEVFQIKLVCMFRFEILRSFEIGYGPGNFEDANNSPLQFAAFAPFEALNDGMQFSNKAVTRHSFLRMASLAVQPQVLETRAAFDRICAPKIIVAS